MSRGDVFANEADLDETIDSSFTSADDLNEGGLVSEECKCHLLVVDVKKEAREGKVPRLRFDLQVQASDKPRQRGRFLYHSINLKKGVYEKKTGKLLDLEPLSEGSEKAKLRFALGLGLIAQEDIGKKDLKIPWSKAFQKHCLADLKRGSEIEDKTTHEKKPGFIGIQYGEVFQLDDERCKDWPRDLEASNPANLDDF